MAGFVRVLLVFAAVSALAPGALAHNAHHRHKGQVHAAPADHYADHYHAAYAHAHAGKVHRGGHGHTGYWRRGPKEGYGFGFSTYRKDPFGADDYYDGNRCHYRRHHDFCYYNTIFTGFR
jgi:hypothetical protein